MVRRTRKKGGMFKKVAQPLGRATLVLAEEYGKDWAQKKGPKVLKGINDDPGLANDTTFVLTGIKKMPTPKFYKNTNNYPEEDSENINPNIMKGGKTNKRRISKKRKTVKTRK
jgi:hypothetical protein